MEYKMTANISVRLDNNLLHSLEKWTKELKSKKSDFIKNAIRSYIKEKEKEQLRSESLRTREESLKVNKDFEGTLSDGI
jgi:metal-responsive CopG/Arc/MetJ family transcriptional regulator